VNGTTRRGVIIGSNQSGINGASTSAVLIGAQSGILSSAVNSVATGASPNITAFSNVLAHGATATANNQAIFGTRMDVTGGDLTVLDVVSPDNSFNRYIEHLCYFRERVSLMYGINAYLV